MFYVNHRDSDNQYRCLARCKSFFDACQKLSELTVSISRDAEHWYISDRDGNRIKPN